MHKLARHSDKPNPRLEEYMRKNGITFKKATEISGAQIDACTSGEQLFSKLFYTTSLDAFEESLEYAINKETFGLMVDMLHSSARVFEPCCMGGYLGAWLASSVKGINYTGMDINPVAIEKAREVAFSNVVNPACFIVGDYRVHSARYDYVIGRKVTNRKNEIDIDAIKKICSLADEVVILHFMHANIAELTAVNLGHSYAECGFFFEQVSEPFRTACDNDTAAFVYRAFKKPEAY